MADFWFFKTMDEKGRNRLRPLANQTLGGKEVHQELNVQSDKAIRLRYPLGTIFCSDTLILRTGFYETGTLKVINMTAEERSAHPSDEASDAMKLAYLEYIRSAEHKSMDPTDSTDEAPRASKSIVKDTLLSKMRRNKELNPPSLKDGFYVDKDNWYLLLRNITNQVNTMLVGPTGTGKTELVMMACKRLGIRCSVYDMGSMYDPVAGLLGVHRLQEGGVSVFDYAKFTKDIQEPGVILLDELSRAPVMTNNILFPCLDSRRKLPVEIAGGDDLREIKVHSECTFIATANVGSEYTGTMSMDRALVCRFFPLELDYMPKASEVDILVNRCGIPVDYANNVVSVANSIRDLYRKQEISCSVSTRETLMVGDLIADGWSTLNAMVMVFLPLFEGTKSEGERGVVNRLFMTR